MALKPEKIVLFVSQNATVGSLIIRVLAVDNDIGANGAVLYRLKKDARGHYKTFTIDQESGELRLLRPLDKENQRKYNVSSSYLLYQITTNEFNLTQFGEFQEFSKYINSYLLHQIYNKYK